MAPLPYRAANAELEELVKPELLEQLDESVREHLVFEVGQASANGGRLDLKPAIAAAVIKWLRETERPDLASKLQRWEQTGQLRRS